jgi:zinc protease
MEMPGLFLVQAFAQQGCVLADIEGLLREQLDAITVHGVSKRELEKAQNTQETSFIRDLESMQSRADTFNAYHVLTGEAGMINSEIERIQSVTVDDIDRVAASYLHPDNSTTLHYIPNPKRPQS